MQQRLPSLYSRPILFAHRGASAYAHENTSEAFELALRIGATGLETDCWVTKDQQVVLDHDGVVKLRTRTLFKTKKIQQVIAAELEPSIISFADLLKIAAPSTPISVDVCDPTAMPIINTLVSNFDQKSTIFICHPDLSLLRTWKQIFPDFKYVNSTRLSKLDEGPERRCADLAMAGIDALNMHHSDWSGGLVALAHRFDRAAFSWDIQHAEQMNTALLMGVDAIYSDWPDRMSDAYRSVFETEQV